MRIRLVASQRQHRYERRKAQRADEREDRYRLQRQQQPARHNRSDQVAAAAGHSEPAQSFGFSLAAAFSDIGDRHGAVNRCRCTVQKTNDDKLAGCFNQLIEKRHACEYQRANQKPQPPAHSIRKQTQKAASSPCP